MSTCANCKHFSAHEVTPEWVERFEARIAKATTERQKYEAAVAAYKAKSPLLRFLSGGHPGDPPWPHVRSDLRELGYCTLLPNWEEVGVKHWCSHFEAAE